MILPITYTSYGYKNNDLRNAATKAISEAVKASPNPVCAAFRGTGFRPFPEGFDGFTLCEARNGYLMRVYINPFDRYGKKTFKAVKVSVKETGRVREESRRADGTVCGSYTKVTADVEFDLDKIVAIIAEANAAYLDAKARTEKAQDDAKNAQLNLNAKVEAAIPGATTSPGMMSLASIGNISFRPYELDGKLYCSQVSLELCKYDCLPAEAVRRIAEIVKESIDPVVASGKAEFQAARQKKAQREAV